MPEPKTRRRWELKLFDTPTELQSGCTRVTTTQKVKDTWEAFKPNIGLFFAELLESLKVLQEKMKTETKKEETKTET